MGKKIVYTTEFIENDLDELKPGEKDLLSDALDATQRAYAPYSGFFVGAAIRLENGKIITGNNQENAAYPSGLCAERVAIFSAYAQYPGIKISEIALRARSRSGTISSPIPPCGACRQAMLEYENLQGSNIRIMMMGETGKVISTESVKSLLPLSFGQEQLGNP